MLASLTRGVQEEKGEGTHYWGTRVAPLQMIGNTTLLSFLPGHRLCAQYSPIGTTAPSTKPMYSHVYLPAKNRAGATAPQMIEAE